MKDFKATACNLCYANCGVLTQLDEGGRRIVKVRGDKQHPVSQGYTCNKAARIDYYQNGRDRLTSPLRRREDGGFDEIDWDTAISEIAERLTAIRESVGGDKIFYYGGGGQGNHLGGAYASPVRQILGMRYGSNALAQEKTGLAWMSRRMLGGHWHGDFDECDVAMIIGKNPWQSNGLQRARVVMRDIARDDNRTLIVFDPRRSETAELADIHLAVKPGTDVWCIGAILGYLVQNDMADLDWIRANATGYERLLDHLQGVPVEEYAAFSGVPMSDIVATAEAMAATNKIAVYEDLGVEMSPHSTLCSYLNIALFLFRGSFAIPGGMYLTAGLGGGIFGDGGAGTVNEAGYEEGYRTSPVTGARIISGLLPCNSIPEEIVTEHPDRFRGMIVESANPVNSLADSDRFREAFEALELVVVIDVAMTETAQLADYVLPASSQYEKFESTVFNFEYPRNFFHLRHPLMAPLQGTLPEPEIHARLFEALHTFDEDIMTMLHDAAAQGQQQFATVLFGLLGENPELGGFLPYLVYRTLGPTLPHNAAGAAAVWGMCQMLTFSNPEAVRRAGFSGEGFELGIALFNKILESRSGTMVLAEDPADTSRQFRLPGGKVQLRVSEMLDELDTLPAFELPERSDDFPMILAAGERRLYTANTIIRDPDWMKSNNPTSLQVNPVDAKALGIEDATTARLVTKRGRLSVLVEYDERMREGTMSLPNGLGLSYPNEAGVPEVTGVSTNELTDLEDRDPWVGTPWHKHVRARLEPSSKLDTVSG